MLFALSFLSTVFADDIIYSKRIENFYVRDQYVNIDFYFDKSIKKDYFYNEKSLLKSFNYISKIHNNFYSTNIFHWRRY